ncbi:MAG: 50S ribosomal protein L13 [Thermotogae bacterium]|nr:50S ribosomal protein L13 [Thermotogota bacterium]
MTPFFRKEDIEREWYVVDATGKTLGRLASEIAKILMGKHKPQYTPHADMGDFVVVINAHRIKITGKKLQQKTYRWHSGYPSGLKERPLWWMLQHHPEKVLYLAVKGMLPKNKLRKRRLKRLKIYTSDTHPHAAQRPKELQVEA